MMQSWCVNELNTCGWYKLRVLRHTRFASTYSTCGCASFHAQPNHLRSRLLKSFSC
ncbi:hypothetical protein GQ600_23596 [Phytophthora cactorum]|nr:hypothetical protein GQ600_23596 [Phytophthora cactorum]